MDSNSNAANEFGPAVVGRGGRGASSGNPIGLLAGKTRTGTAFDSFARATERLRRLEHEARGAFDELATAQELLAVEGVTADVELDPGIAAAFSEWKRHAQREEARAIAREEVGR